MGLLAVDGHWATTCGAFSCSVLRTYGREVIPGPNFFHSHRVNSKYFRVECSAKRSRKRSKTRKRANDGTDESLIDTSEILEAADGSSLKINHAQEDDSSYVGASASESSVVTPSRDAVLRACIVTSGFLAALGVGTRQVSHVAFVEGFPVTDCTEVVTFGFEMWHLELITGLVVLVSSSRYLLLKTWPDFAKSSEAANQQVLTSLEPLDYSIVAFLPGISEELLFRGALMPAIGLNWTSVVVVASVFGALHFGSGRKYAFAVWATFVGFVYGWATVASGSVVTPMVAHSLNNLIGGILWRYTNSSSSLKWDQKR